MRQGFVGYAGHVFRMFLDGRPNGCVVAEHVTRAMGERTNRRAAKGLPRCAFALIRVRAVINGRVDELPGAAQDRRSPERPVGGHPEELLACWLSVGRILYGCAVFQEGEIRMADRPRISNRVAQISKSAIHEMTRLSKEVEDVAFLSAGILKTPVCRCCERRSPGSSRETTTSRRTRPSCWLPSELLRASPRR